MKDCSENIIIPATSPNSHFVVTGKSGMGKSYCLYRLIEREIENDRQVLILDFSDSFTEEERKKANFKYERETQILGLFQNRICLPILNLVDVNKRAGLIADVVGEAADIKGFMQKKILYKICKKLPVKEEVSLDDIGETACKLYEDLVEDEDKTQAQLVEKILDKLDPLLGEGNLFFTTVNDSVPKIRIISMEALSDETKDMATKLFLACEWQGIKRRKKNFDTFVLDEIQHLSLGKRGVVTAMIREGRKFDCAMIMATQFYSEEHASLLGQAAHWLFFRPADRDVKRIAKMIYEDNVEQGIWILKKLEVGQALYHGYFSYNNNREQHQENVVVRF